jgi:hypothetical protein
MGYKIPFEYWLKELFDLPVLVMGHVLDEVFDKVNLIRICPTREFLRSKLFDLNTGFIPLKRRCAPRHSPGSSSALYHHRFWARTTLRLKAAETKINDRQ